MRVTCAGKKSVVVCKNLLRTEKNFSIESKRLALVKPWQRKIQFFKGKILYKRLNLPSKFQKQYFFLLLHMSQIWLQLKHSFKKFFYLYLFDSGTEMMSKVKCTFWYLILLIINKKGKPPFSLCGRFCTLMLKSLFEYFCHETRKKGIKVPAQRSYIIIHNKKFIINLRYDPFCEKNGNKRQIIRKNMTIENLNGVKWIIFIWFFFFIFC